MSTCPAAGGMRPIDALRSSRQQLPREDVTVSVHVRGAVVVRAVKKRSTLVVALLVLVLLRSKRYLYGKHNTSTALTGPGDTGVDGRLRPIRQSKSRFAIVVDSLFLALVKRARRHRVLLFASFQHYETCDADNNYYSPCPKTSGTL